jgi:hypothetical protein
MGGHTQFVRTVLAVIAAVVAVILIALAGGGLR